MARKTGSHSEITGPRIREEALRLFARHGYAAVSMRKIAEAVGVQAGALYLYTPDKQSLLFDLMKAHMDELLEAWRQADPGGAVEKRLDAFVRFHIRHHLERADAVFISYMELRNLEPVNFTVIEDQRRTYETALEDILQAGADAGVFVLADAKMATLSIIAMLTGVNAWYRDDGRLARGEVLDIYLDLVRGAVGSNKKATDEA